MIAGTLIDSRPYEGPNMGMPSNRSTSFTVSKGAPKSSGGVFREVSSSGHTTKVMSSNAYGKASERANKSLAASALSQKSDRKK
jgi:hypothetical protein